MPFAKGKPKTGGRKPGTPNRITGTLRELLETFLTDTFDQICTEFDALEGRDKIAAYIRLLEFTLPKLNRVEAQIPEVEEQPQMNLSVLTVEELREMIRIMEKAEKGLEGG